MAGNVDNLTNIDQQRAEIEDIKSSFQGQCRVIQDLGEFTHVLTLQPEGQSIVYKFQMTGNYPKELPTLIIRSPDLNENEISQLRSAMQDLDVKGPLMIKAMLKKAEEIIQEQNLSVKQKTKTSHAYEKTGKKGKEKRRKRKEKIEEEEVKNEKKASMKTADDVIKRIQWDTDLPQDEFLVGYVDRFLGIQEKYFTSFSWEDIASVDYSVLAVPKHRIEYFKYKDVIVWNKQKRLDNVFGSTGSKLTIYDVIANYEKEQVSNSKSTDDDSDDDSDDGITITIGGAQSGAVDMEENDNEQFDSDNEEEDEYDKYWRNKLRPNYFLALRITDPDIVKTAEGIQDIILEHEPQYDSCCIPPHCLHLTLCTLGLDSPEQVAHCVQALNRLKPELSSLIRKDKPIVFKGIEQFFSRVVYAKTECPQEFLDFVDHLKLCLQNEGIEIRDNHDFVPHMTIMKITRPVGRSTGKKYVAPWIYSEKSDVEFGCQVFDNIHLCEMGPDRREDGFYRTPISIEF